MGIRHVVLRLRTCAAARAREAMAERGQARSCVRARAIGEEARAATSAAVGSAQACFRSALLNFVKGQRRVQAAADVTGRRLRRASDVTASTVLRIAYGESAPPTPSPLQILMIIYQKAKKIDTAVTTIQNLIAAFENMDPYLRAAIVGFLLAPFAFLENAVPTAQEPVCPFLGIQGLPFDIFPVDQALAMVGFAAKITILTFGGLCLTPFFDLYDIWIADDVLTPDKPIDPDFVASRFPFSEAKKLKRMALLIIADRLSQQDDVTYLWDLFHLVETIGTQTTIHDLKCALERVASELSKHELKILMNAQEMKQGMGSRGVHLILMMMTKFHVPDMTIDMAYTPHRARGGAGGSDP